MKEDTTLLEDMLHIFQIILLTFIIIGLNYAITMLCAGMFDYIRFIVVHWKKMKWKIKLRIKRWKDGRKK
jgi:hypothetical protein